MYIGKPKIINGPRDEQVGIVSGNESVTLTCKVTGDDIIGGHWKGWVVVHYQIKLTCHHSIMTKLD